MLALTVPSFPRDSVPETTVSTEDGPEEPFHQLSNDIVADLGQMVVFPAEDIAVDGAVLPGGEDGAQRVNDSMGRDVLGATAVAVSVRVGVGFTLGTPDAGAWFGRSLL